MFFLVCSYFVNDFSTTRGPIHAKFCMRAYSAFRYVFSYSIPLLGVSGPREAEKGGNEIFVNIGVNGEFLHFGGFWAIFEQCVDGSTPNFICVGTMSVDVLLPPLGSIGHRTAGLCQFYWRTCLALNWTILKKHSKIQHTWEKPLRFYRPFSRKKFISQTTVLSPICLEPLESYKVSKFSMLKKYSKNWTHFAPK